MRVMGILVKQMRKVLRFGCQNVKRSQTLDSVDMLEDRCYINYDIYLLIIFYNLGLLLIWLGLDFGFIVYLLRVLVYLLVNLLV